MVVGRLRRTRDTSSARPSSAQSGSPRTVAILFFENNAPVDAARYTRFVESITDQLITELGRRPTLRLVERSRIQEIFAEQDLAAGGLIDQNTAARMGRTLGAQYVIVGNFVVVGDRLRLSSRTLAVETGEVVARQSHSVEGSAARSLALVPQLAERIRLGLRLPSEVPQRVGGIGVLPFTTASEDPRLRAIAFALGDLLTTDLAISRHLQVVERRRLADVLREITLRESGRVDTTTAPGLGKLIHAERLVLGSVQASGTPQELRIQIQLSRSTDGVIETAVDAEAPLVELIAVEKALARRVFEYFRVQLTPMEQERLDATPTRNIEALIAYGEAVEQEWLGQYANARRGFRSASVLDPSFSSARTREIAARRMVESPVETPIVIPGIRPVSTAVAVAVDRVNQPLPLNSTTSTARTDAATQPTTLPTATIHVQVIRP